MFFEKYRLQLANLYQEYPRTFWTLVLVTFIDRLGGALLFPFFALYITSKFGVGMTEVGVLFAVFAGSSFFGSFIGGALTDRIGRKAMLIFSLISTSFSAVAMGLVDSMEAFFVLAIVVGVLTDTGGPAHQAMVADLLPREKRSALAPAVVQVKAYNWTGTLINEGAGFFFNERGPGRRYPGYWRAAGNRLRGLAGQKS